MDLALGRVRVLVLISDISKKIYSNETFPLLALSKVAGVLILHSDVSASGC